MTGGGEVGVENDQMELSCKPADGPIFEIKVLNKLARTYHLQS